jgi:hypothetical protein
MKVGGIINNICFKTNIYIKGRVANDALTSFERPYGHRHMSISP